ncbi:MAG: dihydroorotate dehydrogenase electron transfer subunit [Candidatus Aminicenantia bacterium]
MLIDSSAEITLKKNWSDWVLLSLRSSKIASLAKPGQFIMVKVSDGYYPLIRRPFSIHNIALSKNHPTAVEIFFQVVGYGTSLLAQKKVRERLDIVGPLGKGFSLSENLKDKKLYLIGGGRGIAPLFFLAKEIKKLEGEPIVFYGGKSKKDLPLVNQFLKEKIMVLTSTEDGSYGWKGLITHLVENNLEEEKDPIEKIFTCGPEEMMKKVAQIAKEKNIKAEFSLESIMGCGFGACWGCVVKVKKNRQECWVKTCSEGPVFSQEEIIW